LEHFGVENVEIG